MPVKLVPASKEQQGALAATASSAVTLTEDSLATFFEQEHIGRLVYAHNRGQWLIYGDEDGTWERDLVGLVPHRIRESVRNLNEAQQAKWAKSAVVSAVEKFCQRAPGLARLGDEFDNTPHLVGTPLGVYDLRSGEPLPKSPYHYVSQRTSVSPSAFKPELWLKFLYQATGGNTDLVGYLQRLAGYCLTGDAREEVVVFLHGPGGNGKGVFMNALRDILGEYARQAAMQLLLASKGDRHPTDLANLYGARLVLASESPEGRRWDDERVKALTGRDAISARFMNRDFFQFIPCFKLLVASNHKPRISTVDDAWRRRLHLVPFTSKPERPDPELKDKMVGEYPSILQWMIEGAEWWYREGLCAPEVVTKATEEYFREEDVIGLWFAESCETTLASSAEERTALHQSYAAWCRSMGHAAANVHSMTRWFKSHGFEQHPTNKTRPIMGVKLKP